VSPARWAARLVLAALVVLAARALAYALAPPTPLAARLEGRVGGPSFPLVAALALTLGLALAAALVWLASVGVRERHLLAAAPGEPPRIQTRALAGEAVLLFAVASLAFASLESYLHYRAGLGFHGLRCLVGPVHRDAPPLLAALSAVAAAFRVAAAHVVAWIRRTVGVLGAALRRSRPRDDPAPALRPAHVSVEPGVVPRPGLGARAPPRVVARV
jgi:hypothetical protein